LDNGQQKKNPRFVSSITNTVDCLLIDHAQKPHHRIAPVLLPFANGFLMD
jgi:membrane peptidoglycan carboxypeptidase